jgi:hypothetical protein
MKQIVVEIRPIFPHSGADCDPDGQPIRGRLDM